jgi:amino acid transporter
MNYMRFLSSLVAIPSSLLTLLFFFLPWVAVTMTVSCQDMGIEETRDMDASGFELTTGEAEDEFTVMSDEINTAGDQMSQEMFEEGFSEGFETGTGESDFDSDSIEFSTDTEAAETDEVAEASEGFLAASPILGAVLFAAVVTLGLSLLRVFDPNIYPKMWAGVTYVVLGMLGLLAQLIHYFDMSSDFSDIEDAIEDSFAGGEMFGISSPLQAQFDLQIGWYLTLFGLVAIVIAGMVAFTEREPPKPPPDPNAPLPWEDQQF